MSGLPPTSQAQSFRSAYDLAFQISPLILQGGIVGSSQGSLAPITDYTGGSLDLLDDAFAHYLPLPGSTLISQTIGMYPFANQSVAANATIQQPLTISLAMIAPVNQPDGYQAKLSIFSNLVKQLALHNSIGGTYIVCTPANIYNYLLMTAMTDITPEISADGNKQSQVHFQLDFIQPILTAQGAQQALNAQMQKQTNGNRQQPNAISWSGNQASSPAANPGITGMLANVEAAVSVFGGTI